MLRFNYRSLVDNVFKKFVFKVHQIFNISSSSEVQKLKILQLCDLISCGFIILPICYFLILKKYFYRVQLFFHGKENPKLLCFDTVMNWLKIDHC